MIVSVQIGERLGIVLDFAEIFALQPLGRQLDRRQRILDLMGDAARDIGPGCLALRREQLGDVVEGDDIAFGFAVDALGGDADQQYRARAGAHELNLHFRQAFRRGIRPRR